MTNWRGTHFVEKINYYLSTTYGESTPSPTLASLEIVLSKNHSSTAADFEIPTNPRFSSLFAVKHVRCRPPDESVRHLQTIASQASLVLSLDPTCTRAHFRTGLRLLHAAVNPRSWYTKARTLPLQPLHQTSEPHTVMQAFCPCWPPLKTLPHLR